jgi:hypothetical protein
MQVGPINIPGVTPAGSTITMALAAWVGAHDTWIAAGQANEHRGVVAFHTATVNYNLEPPPTPPDISAGWTAAGVDLIMNAWPEPSSLSLMALGLGALLIRRRK